MEHKDYRLTLRDEKMSLAKELLTKGKSILDISDIIKVTERNLFFIIKQNRDYFKDLVFVHTRPVSKKYRYLLDNKEV